MEKDFTYKAPGTFISPPGKNGEDVGKTIMVFHHRGAFRGVSGLYLQGTWDLHLGKMAKTLGKPSWCSGPLSCFGVLPAATLTLSKHKFFASEKASLLDAKNL